MQNQLQPSISPADRARLLLNAPELANRSVTVADKAYPILHLGIGDMEKFRAFTVNLESLYNRFCESELTLYDFIDIYSDEFISYLSKEIPHAASVALRLPVEQIKRIGRPADLLAAVFSQWMHNLEVGKLRELFPYPESEDDKEDTTNPDNPMVIIERLMSGLHFSKEEALKTTYPQVYLMGLSSAESYEAIKADSDGESSPKNKSQKVHFRGREFNSVKEMVRELGPEAYTEYYQEMTSRVR